MLDRVQKYTHWLHTQWPAGTVEKGPVVNEDGTTTIQGIRIVGDLTGIPLLKFSAHTGALAIQNFLQESSYQPSRDPQDNILDVAIIGAGVSGIASAIEASKNQLHYRVYESSEAFSTIKNFPKRKPIFTYPTDMTPTGGMSFQTDVKEDLLDELNQQKQAAHIEVTNAKVDQIKRQSNQFIIHFADGSTQAARRVIIAIGRSGNYRKMNIPGEELDKVSNRLHDPKEFKNQNVLVVGGGDSALEAAIALTENGAHTTLSYRKASFSRPKPENMEKLASLSQQSDQSSQADSPQGSLNVVMDSRPSRITPQDVTLVRNTDKSETTLPNDYTLALIGREAPLDFFRRSGIPIVGDWNLKAISTLVLFFAFCIWMYHWKSGGNAVYDFFQSRKWFPFQLSGGDPTTLWGTLLNASKDPGFYYSLAYCCCVVAFGIRRIKRRRTPYVKVQTLTLILIQCIPLFILPYIFFPYLGHNGAFSGGGFGQWFGDTFFPDASYWRSFGFILAWPLFIWNVFTPDPVWGWLVLSLVQTFVIIPLIVRRWGKGAYCGWMCSCGALAETLGDAHRHKMPHGPLWNKLNMIGQVILAAALLLLGLRILGWIIPSHTLTYLFNGMLKDWGIFSYKYLVDLWIAGIIGVGFYFHLSGRVWCRFACPLAALMHIYARFTKFRIFTEKKKCISCNVCTSVCHQGIDIMNFANKGLPMEDPECVRCSACVQSCPTGVLQFGRYDKDGSIAYDTLPASPVLMKESEHASKLLASVG